MLNKDWWLLRVELWVGTLVIGHNGIDYRWGLALIGYSGTVGVNCPVIGCGGMDYGKRLSLTGYNKTDYKWGLSCGWLEWDCGWDCCVIGYFGVVDGDFGLITVGLITGGTAIWLVTVKIVGGDCLVSTQSINWQKKFISQVQDKHLLS